MLNYQTLKKPPLQFRRYLEQVLRALGNSAVCVPGVFTSCVGTFWRTLISSVLLEMPGSHLLLGRGQDIKKSKSRVLPGAQWT